MLAERLQRAGCRTRLMIGNMVFRRPGDPDKPSTPEFLVTEFRGLKVTTGYAMVWPGMSAQETALDDLAVYQEKPRRFCDHPF